MKKGLKFFALFNDAVGIHYHKDTTRAGIVTSGLGPGSYYASVCRYDSGGRKEVVCSVNGETLTTALRALASYWLELVSEPESLLEDLRDSL